MTAVKSMKRKTHVLITLYDILTFTDLYNFVIATFLVAK